MVLQIRNSIVAYIDIHINHNSSFKPGLSHVSVDVHSVHGHISQQPHIAACMVVFGVISGDHMCPEPKNTTVRDPGCPRKKITFFS